MGHHLGHSAGRPGHRFNVDQREHLRSFGTDIAIIFGGKTGAQTGGYAAGRDIRLTIDDAIAIQQQASLVKTVSPELRRMSLKLANGMQPAVLYVEYGRNTSDFAPSPSGRDAS